MDASETPLSGTSRPTDLGLLAEAEAMRKVGQTLFDDVLAVFRRACQEEQYGLADHLLAALESMTRPHQDDQLLDQAYLIFAGCAT